MSGCRTGNCCCPASRRLRTSRAGSTGTCRSTRWPCGPPARCVSARRSPPGREHQTVVIDQSRLDAEHFLHRPPRRHKRGLVHLVRRILVHSISVVEAAPGSTRNGCPGTATRWANSPSATAGWRLGTHQNITARIGVSHAVRRHVTSCLRWTKPRPRRTAALQWHLDQEVLDAEAAVRGRVGVPDQHPGPPAGPDQALVSAYSLKSSVVDLACPQGSAAEFGPPVRGRPRQSARSAVQC